MEGRLLYGPTPHSTPYFEQAKRLCGAQSFATTSIGWLGHHLIFCCVPDLLIEQVNICCTINVMGCTRLQCFATFCHEFSCQSVVTGGAGWLVHPSSPWYHVTPFIVNMVPWYSVQSQHGTMVLYGMVGTPIIVPPTLPTTVKRDGSRVNCTDNCTISCTDIPIVQIVPFVLIYQPFLKSVKSM